MTKKTKKTWPADQRAEFETLCRVAWWSAETADERTDMFLWLLTGAEECRRAYAEEMLREFPPAGAWTFLKNWSKQRNQIAVAYDGRMLSKPRTVGATRADEGGQTYVVQMLFDFMTWAEIEAKISEFLRQTLAYKENIHTLTRLLELRDLAPGTATPSEAADRLGTTVEAFLSEAA